MELIKQEIKSLVVGDSQNFRVRDSGSRSGLSKGCTDVFEASQLTYFTINSSYDRNLSIVYAGNDCWLSWTKADTYTVYSDTNVDSEIYVVYYKTAGSIVGLAVAAETQLTLSELAHPTDFDQRVASATCFNDKVYVFLYPADSPD